MTFDAQKLSAYLDGELSPEETHAVETALSQDAALQAELESLMAADDLARAEFGQMLEEPVPLSMAAAIRSAPQESPRAAPAASGSGSSFGGLRFAAMAASIALVIGAGGGFFAARTTAPEIAVAGGWLADIADYHAVYATQVRHLVEVPASEATHISAWLGTTLGTDVRVPELSDHGLSFEGARLLVAAGRPVAQLIYTDAGGQVVALCQIASAAPQDGFADRTINAFDMVTFGNDEANFVVISDQGRGDLGEIARTAASQV